MTGTNEITGDRLVGKGNNSNEYQEAWERTFGSKKEIPLIWDTNIGATQVDYSHCGLDCKNDTPS